MRTTKSIGITRGTRCAMLLSLLVGLGTLACATGPTPELKSHTMAINGSREFQRTYEQQLRDDPVSFLTAVAAHYLASGDAISVSIDPGIKLDFEATDEALIVQHGAKSRRFEDSGVLPLDARYTLAISRQEQNFRVLIHDRAAPLRAGFPGITWFPNDGRFIVEARYRASSPRKPMLLQTSRGVSKILYVAGEATFELDGAAASLLVFAYAPDPQPGEPVLIPFRDATSGAESYEPGRYLEPELPTGDTLVLDFNRATNPLCAYSEHYNCPMPPRFNVLPFAVTAGAKAPH